MKHYKPLKNVDSDKTKRAPVIAASYIILYFNAIYIYGAMDLQLLNNMIL